LPNMTLSPARRVRHLHPLRALVINFLNAGFRHRFWCRQPGALILLLGPE
jgi:hypothetical protein